MDQRELVDRYCDAVPRALARVEEYGTVRLFVPQAGHAWYARPAGGYVTAADVQAVLERQRVLGLPPSIEWVVDRPPGLDEMCAQAGLVVHRYPLLAATPEQLRAPPLVEAQVRLLDPDDDDLATSMAVADLAFSSPGSALGDRMPGDVDAFRPDAAAVALLRERLALGRPVVAAAFVDGQLVARGGHTVEGGVSEITGVATLPALRRRGLAAVVTSVLAQDAARLGAELVWLSAESDDVARVYSRLGFRQIGWSGAAGID